MSTQSPEPDAWQALGVAFDNFFAAMGEALKPVGEAFAQLGESLGVLVNFTIEHIAELADRLHEEAGKPYGDEPDAGLRWLHDELEKRSHI
jgi:hypothetical protein